MAKTETVVLGIAFAAGAYFVYTRFLAPKPEASMRGDYATETPTGSVDTNAYAKADAVYGAGKVVHEAGAKAWDTVKGLWPF